MRILVILILLLLAGCGHSSVEVSREVQYLQAAEEVKAEEQRLSDMEELIEKNRSAIDTVYVAYDLELEVVKSQFDGKIEDLKSKWNIYSSKYQSEFDLLLKQHEKDMFALLEKAKSNCIPFEKNISEVKEQMSSQTKTIAAARARRDALSPQAK